MSEILDTRSVQHFLNFITNGEGEIQVDEPIGFDAAEFVLEQEDKRYGRDVSFSGGEIDFGFPNSAGSKLGYQFDLLKTYDTIHGFESQVEYLLKDTDGNTYVIGELDFLTKKTDGITYFDTTVIQSTTQIILKRRSDIGVDLFGTEDLDDNTITAIGTSNILLEAKPVIQVSAWNAVLPSFNDTIAGASIMHLTPFQGATETGIETTAGPVFNKVDDQNINADFYEDVFNNFWISSQEDLSNITITISNLVVSFFIATGSDFTNDDWQTSAIISFDHYILPIGLDSYSQSDVYPDGNSVTQSDNLSFTTEFIGNESIDRFTGLSGTADRYDVTFDDVTITLVEGIPRGHHLTSLITIARNNTLIDWLSGSASMTATSTAINSVTKGIRLVDAMSQVLLNISDVLALNAPRFEESGEWFDNFIFDGNLIRGRDTKYPLKWDDISNFTQEFNADFEVVEEEVFYGKYDDYYTNQESACFLQIPDETFNIAYNELYAINQYNFNYKNFNQDKDDDNTIDGVHTETQFAVINKRAENDKEIDLDQIRDPFLLETTRKKAVESNQSGTSSLSQDNKTFMVDVVEITVETGGFSAGLNHIVNEDDTGYLLLINDGSFNWTLLGFSVGDTFTIVNTDNADDYTVITIEGTTVTLDPVAITATNIGRNVTEVEYPYSNVDFKMRTDEGFTSITGIQGPDTFTNLLYTPKRNILNNWSSYLATAVTYNSSDIKIQSFVNEPTLVTQFGAGDVITENSNITQAELDTALLTPRLIITKVISDFSDYQDFKNSIQSVRGFVRVFDNENRVLKGYPKSSSYDWKNNLLELILEQKFENEITDITFDEDASSFIIAEVGYDTDIVPKIEYVAEEDTVQLFDALTRPLTNRARFDRYSVNSTIFDTVLELITAIEDL